MSRIKVKRLSDAIGAEIAGVDLSQELDEETVRAIEDAWHEHQIILFRDQDITNDQQRVFAEKFGELGSRFRPGTAPPEMDEYGPNVMLVSNIRKDGQPIEEWNYLDNFFKRYNKVLLDVMGIEREKDRLKNENGDLRSILKQYLDGISVNEDVINNPNPLLVVNHKTNIVMASAYNQRPPPATVVEGAHAVMSHINNGLMRGQQGASI